MTPDIIPFVVFKTPLSALDSADFLERVIKKALFIERQTIPSRLIERAGKRWGSEPFLPSISPYLETSEPIVIREPEVEKQPMKKRYIALMMMGLFTASMFATHRNSPKSFKKQLLWLVFHSSTF